jgi:hypothetical protein
VLLLSQATLIVATLVDAGNTCPTISKFKSNSAGLWSAQLAVWQFILPV